MRHSIEKERTFAPVKFAEKCFISYCVFCGPLGIVLVLPLCFFAPLCFAQNVHRASCGRKYFTLTWFFQGSSFLNPRAYAVMHRMHHAHSDTEKIRISCFTLKDVLGMMKHTKKIWRRVRNGQTDARIQILP